MVDRMVMWSDLTVWVAGDGDWACALAGETTRRLSSAAIREVIDESFMSV
jgi:hypothetical protein